MRHIAREYEKGAECKQQSVVHEQKRLRLQNQQRGSDDDKPYPPFEHAENYHHRDDEQHEIYHNAPHGRSGLGRGFQLNRFGSDEKARPDNQHECHRERKRHYLEKFRRLYRVKGVKVQILRIAERRKHTAQIRRHVLHYEHESGIFSLSARREDEPAQRQKGYKSHVVRHDHRAEISDENQRESNAPHIAESGDYLYRQPFEKPPAFKRGDNRQSTEQAGKRIQVEVIRISRVRRHEKAGDSRRHRRDYEHDMPFYQAFYYVSDMRFYRPAAFLVHIRNIYIPLAENLQAF